MSKELFLFLQFVIAFLFALALTPVIKALAIRFNIIDKPNERKMHKKPIPLGGGVAIALSFYLALLIASLLYPVTGRELTSRDVSILFSLFIGGSLTVVLGMVDDIRVMPPKVKLMGQILIILVIIPFGVAITFVSNPFGGLIYLPKFVSIFITILWIAGIMNAINLLDGLDGLLAGVSTISAIIFLCVSLMKGHFLIAMIMAVMAGSTLGFLRYNFNPAQLFMGDTGSLFLGIMFASLSVVGALKGTTTMALFIPVLIMGLPITDTLWAIIRRARKKQPIFKADKEHIHHKLLSLGLTQRQVVLIIYGINIFFGLIGLGLCRFIK